jgi:quinol monooxygenase YgiN
MLIVQGVFRVDPDDRVAFLEERTETMRLSRAEQGCLEYVFGADPLEPDRVILSERWASQADLDAHLAALTERRRVEAEDGAAPGVAVLAREIATYHIESVQQMT